MVLCPAGSTALNLAYVAAGRLDAYYDHGKGPRHTTIIDRRKSRQGYQPTQEWETEVSLKYRAYRYR